MTRADQSQKDRDRREAVEQNNLGKALIQQRRRDEAFAAFERAVQLDPQFAEAHNNFANTLNDQQRYDEAIAHYRDAIRLTPQYVEAYFNLGNALRGKGARNEAIASYEKALEIRPTLVEAYNGIGIVFIDQERYAEAIDVLRKAKALRPRHVSSFINLATALRKSGQINRALETIDKAVEIQPDSVVAWSNRGTILHDLRRYDESIDSLRRAVSLRPEHVDSFNKLVRLLQNLGRAGEAIGICNRIISSFPNYAEAHAELASMLQSVGEVDDAFAACAKALALKPDFSEAHNTLGNIQRDQGNLEAAIQSYRKALELKPDSIGVHANLAFTLQFACGYDSAEILAENVRWAELHATPLGSGIKPHTNDRSPNRPLKIGYVSSYYRLHCAAFFLLPVLANHDADKVQLFCYSGVRQPDLITQQFKALNCQWRDSAGLSDDELAEQICQDKIDILIDTILHMQDSRLLTFARKPAPVQVTWLGYPGTTGLAAIDYRFTDPHLDPPGQNDELYTERSIRLPHTFWCYAPIVDTPEVSPLPAQASGHITFGCFNNFHKVTRATLDLWARVLCAIPNSRLLILSQPGAHRETVRKTFEESGIDPTRINFTARLPIAGYFALYHQIDLCLDTTPYPGHTTTLDSLWMGVPVVTLAGHTTVARGGVSILTNVGLPQLIAKTPGEYVQITKSVTDDLDSLARLRQSLRNQLRASPLMNAKQFALDLEDSYRRMWETFCRPRP